MQVMLYHNRRFGKTTGTANKVIGIVTNRTELIAIYDKTQHKNYWFFIRYIGSVGDFIYTDASTTRLTTNDASGRIQFLKITDAIESSVTGSQVSPTMTVNDVIEINETAVTLTGTTLTQTISDINASTSTHGVTASSSPSPTTATTGAQTLVYGIVGVYPGGVITQMDQQHLQQPQQDRSLWCCSWYSTRYLRRYKCGLTNITAPQVVRMLY